MICPNTIEKGNPIAYAGKRPPQDVETGEKPRKSGVDRRKRARGENVIDYAYVGNDAFLCARPQAADEAGKDGNDAGLLRRLVGKRRKEMRKIRRDKSRTASVGRSGR